MRAARVAACAQVNLVAPRLEGARWRTYDGDPMTRRAATITARPQAPTRALALAVLLALGAPSVRA
jgi:hypothetical protein